MKDTRYIFLCLGKTDLLHLGNLSFQQIDHWFREF